MVWAEFSAFERTAHTYIIQTLKDHGQGYSAVLKQASMYQQAVRLAAGSEAAETCQRKHS
ncbi:MAG: hypothetical protein FRX49_09227 [Trebouxia sp. A1-2]|nr:MAG: hypothetical protein FRX49_09227 [Trebouxia sp. A1-2]